MGNSKKIRGIGAKRRCRNSLSLWMDSKRHVMPKQYKVKSQKSEVANVINNIAHIFLHKAE
jgi:hypothetical protein